MKPIVIDTETERIRPGQLAPRLVCAGVGDDDGCEILLRDEVIRRVFELMAGDRLIVGHFVAYDFAVLCAAEPELIPSVFQLYWVDRVSDTGIREKLIHLAWGVLRKFMRVRGQLEKMTYGLDALAHRHLEIELAKQGGHRLNFGALMDVPVEYWPPGAADYVRADVFTTLGVWQAQEKYVEFLDDECRQVRAEFWLHLMSCWGLRTDQRGVREFAARTQQEYDALEAELIAAKLVRRDAERTRDVAAVKYRVRAAYKRSGLKVPMTSKGNVKTDADVCDQSGDPVLAKYAEISSLKKTLSTDVPLLSTPLLQARFEVLLETGRTSSSPNVQNLPTEVGVRECFAPRPGWVYAIVDYPQIELRTWAQVCLDVLGFSDMAEVLRGGIDPHCQIASLILEIPYEQAVSEYKQDPKGRVYYPRQCGKVVNFGCPGGLGMKRLMDYARKSYGVVLYETEQEARVNSGVSAQRLRNFWYGAWREAIPYFDWVKDQTEVESPRIRQLYSGRYRGRVGFTDAANGFFQGLAADAAKSAGFLISRACYADPKSALYGGRLVNFVHDEFIVEVPDDERAHEAAHELARLAREGAKPFIPDIPLEVEAVLARRWSKKCKPVRGADGRLVPWEMAA
jgi:hypothetical protein